MDEDARQQLFEDYCPLVYRLSRTYLARGGPQSIREDVIQEGMVGLWQAVLHYAQERYERRQFGAYAVFWVRRYILRELDRSFRKQRRESAGPNVEHGQTEPVDSLEAVHDDLAEIVQSLEPERRDLLIGWYGLDGRQPQPTKALAARFHLSPKQVRSRLRRAESVVVERMKRRR